MFSCGGQDLLCLNFSNHIICIYFTTIQGEVAVSWSLLDHKSKYCKMPVLSTRILVNNYTECSRPVWIELKKSKVRTPQYDHFHSSWAFSNGFMVSFLGVMSSSVTCNIFIKLNLQTFLSVWESFKDSEHKRLKTNPLKCIISCLKINIFFAEIKLYYKLNWNDLYDYD